MKTVKLGGAVAVLSVICFMFFNIPLAFAGSLPEGLFNDVPENHWSRESISKLIAHGFVGGHMQNFKGETLIDRYVVSIVISRILDSCRPIKVDKSDLEEFDRISQHAKKNIKKLKSLIRRVEVLEKDIEKLKKGPK